MSAPAQTTLADVAPAAPAQHHPRIRAVRAAMHKSRTRTLTPEPVADDPLDAAAYAAATAAAASSSPATPSSPSLSPSPSTPSIRAPWRRILYAVQPYEDNYVDDTFLNSLITNANVRPVSYLPLCLDACAITQRLCLLVLFLLVFYLMFHSIVPVEGVLMLDGLSIAGGMLVFGSSAGRAHRILLLTLVLLFMSPLLNTLTRAYSSDTIWALTFLLSAIHLLCFDYGWINEAEVATATAGKKESANRNTRAACSPLKGSSLSAHELICTSPLLRLLCLLLASRALCRSMRASSLRSCWDRVCSLPPALLNLLRPSSSLLLLRCRFYSLPLRSNALLSFCGAS